MVESVREHEALIGHAKPSLDEVIAQAMAACSAALARPEYLELADCLSDAPANAEAWFELLSGYPAGQAVAAIQKIKDSSTLAPLSEGRPTIEHYGVLQAVCAALPRLGGLALAPSVKREFAQFAAQVANPSARWRQNFMNGLPPFIVPMIAVSTLRQFPAGALLFAFTARLPYTSLLKFPPHAIPGFVEINSKMKGWGPAICPHINRWRPNTLILSAQEHELSIWRIVQTLQFRPDVKFLMADSWLLSSEVGKHSPHLAWWRAFYVEVGAYLVDLEPADERSGFMDYSRPRTDLYKAGKFNPRRTLALWCRDDMLEWGAHRSDLAERCGESPIVSDRAPRRTRIRSPKTARPGRHNSTLHLWDGIHLLNRNPQKYVLLVLVVPSLLAACASGATLGWAVSAPAFLAALILSWIFQYYFFQ